MKVGLHGREDRCAKIFKVSFTQYLNVTQPKNNSRRIEATGLEEKKKAGEDSEET